MSVSETTEEMTLIILQLKWALGVDKFVVDGEFIKSSVWYKCAVQMSHV